MTALGGVAEHTIGVDAGRWDELGAVLDELGFRPSGSGTLDPDQAAARYGVTSGVKGIRLSHPGCAASDTGHLLVQIWDELASDGLGDAPPLSPGGRWLGLYTSDILQVGDAFADGALNEGRPWRCSPLVRAPFDPEAQPGFFSRFVGLRERFVLSSLFRLACLQRSGFDRPGFGTLDPSTPLPVTEVTHADVVQASFDASFYLDVLGLEPLSGDPHTSGWENRPTAEVLMLEAGQTFTVQRLGTPGATTGHLQVYAPHWEAPDLRDRSGPGHLGLGPVRYRVADLDDFRERALAAGAGSPCQPGPDELGRRVWTFTAPDGIWWTMLEGAA